MVVVVGTITLFFIIVDAHRLDLHECYLFFFNRKFVLNTKLRTLFRLPCTYCPFVYKVFVIIIIIYKCFISDVIIINIRPKCEKP